jgi:hypothetical protein
MIKWHKRFIMTERFFARQVQQLRPGSGEETRVGSLYARPAVAARVDRLPREAAVQGAGLAPAEALRTLDLSLHDRLKA